MPDTLSYADAVRLLGGEKSKVVDWFDKLTGGVLLAASVPVPALLGLFDAKAEFVRLGHELVRVASEKRSGLSRYGRTQRLEAAHAVIAVTAFFETLAEADLPSELSGTQLTRGEQLSLAGARFAADDLVAALFTTAAPVPGPHLPHPALRAALVHHYEELVTAYVAFLRGLAVADGLTETQWQTVDRLLAVLPSEAADRHSDLLARLVGDFPEVGFWLGLHEHEATREELRQVTLGLTELREALAGLSTGRSPDDRRAGLAAAYAAELRQPVITSGEVPSGLTVPTLGEAYVPPLFRIVGLGPDARPSDETWWDEQSIRDDLWQSLVVHLTSFGATRAPLLVFGQPGSGKSVLTRIVAAQLPAADFLVVRVVLRDVYAVGDLQDQIEQAIRNDTGERVDWPALARSAGDALPVVLLDGFDELLQATGVSQTDYLRRVAAFQRREADQGRPLAVVVTSRTSVADRAQPPPGTVAVRLEPFDDAQVRAWVRMWNRVNAHAFRVPDARPLDPATVLSHRALAEQPLLLLMLALYDAEGHDLRQAGDLGMAELYEQLLCRFARREVVKGCDGLPERELDRAVEQELRRLAVVAFGMFNRGVQWITTAELDVDLAALPFGTLPVLERTSLRAPLPEAEVVLGRFFFIHRSRSALEDRRRETYEFLHATFSEYLVARLTGQVVDDLVARDAAASLSWGGGSVDDDLLHALLSYAVLSTRANVLTLLGDRLAALSAAHRDAWSGLLLRLFQAAPHVAGVRRYDDYRPRRLPVPARYAAYGANLLLLMLAAGGEADGWLLFPDAADPVERWRAQVGLWRSQLEPAEWEGLSDLLALQRRLQDGGRDIRVWMDPRFTPPPVVDAAWSLGLTPVEPVDAVQAWTGRHLSRLRRTAHLACDTDADMLGHSLEPVFDKLPTSLAWLHRGDGAAVSPAHALIDAWLLPVRPATERERERVYLRCVLLSNRAGPVPEWDRATYLRLVLDRLAADAGAPAELVAEVLSACAVELAADSQVFQAMMRCVQVVVGAAEDIDLRLLRVVEEIIRAHRAVGGEWLDDVAVDVLVRLHEQGAASVRIPAADASGFDTWYGTWRPDLVERMRPLVETATLPKHRQDGVGDTPEADS